MSRASKLFGNFSEVTFTGTTPMLRQPDTSGANYLQHYSMKARRRKVGNYRACTNAIIACPFDTFRTNDSMILFFFVDYFRPRGENGYNEDNPPAAKFTK